MNSDLVGGFCGNTVRSAVDVIGGKWTMLILWELLHEECRYAELQRRVGGISQNVLSGELKSLTQAGLVERESPRPSRRRLRTASLPKVGAWNRCSRRSTSGVANGRRATNSPAKSNPH